VEVHHLPGEAEEIVVRCEFCHMYVPIADYLAHRARHTKLLPDGQQEDYTSLPPEEREQGSLDGVPRVYLHLGCGGQTIMQEKIIRSYLTDPFMYGDSTFCTGCGRHRSDREFVWQETGENLHAYMEGLRAKAAPGLLGFLCRTMRRIRYLLG
jgi:hypothetical protein